jgi:hypothetical protein
MRRVDLFFFYAMVGEAMARIHQAVVLARIGSTEAATRPFLTPGTLAFLKSTR